MSWTGQPNDGQYRVVAVGTDNVGDVSTPIFRGASDGRQHSSINIRHLPGQRVLLQRQRLDKWWFDPVGGPGDLDKLPIPWDYGDVSDIAHD